MKFSKLREVLTKKVEFRAQRPFKFYPKPEGCFRLVTFNVHFGQNVMAIAEAIKSNRNLASADVVLLQEVEDHSQERSSRAAKIAKALKWNFTYVPARRLALNWGTQGLATLSRLPIKSVKVIKLPVYKLLRLRPRVAIAAEINIFGQTVKIYNVHLNGSLNYGKRILQLQEVIGNIFREQRGQPIILAGDFNTIPLLMLAGTSIPLFYDNQKRKFHSFLKRLGFEISCQQAGHTSAWGLVKFQLDGIYPKNAKMAQFGVERSVRISDHFPLWADIKIV